MSYIGDKELTDAVQKIWGQVTGNKIGFDGREGTLSRDALCRQLAERHNSGLGFGQSRTSAAFLGQTISARECAAALHTPRGYPTLDGWTAWAGKHQGHWFGQDKNGTDSARWHRPRLERSHHGPARTYNLQPVEFLHENGALKHRALNQSHRDVNYIWGYDPKDKKGDEELGKWAPHIGFTFDKETTRCIVWLTPSEAFLECIRLHGGQRLRTSVGFWGYGQWTVSDI